MSGYYKNEHFIGLFKFVIIAAVLMTVPACQSSDPPEDASRAETLFTLIKPGHSGVRFKNQLTEDKKNNHLVNDMFISGAGVAVGDINNDGYPDLFFTGNQVPDKLYLNKGGLQFEDITKKAGIEAEDIWSSGATMGDIDNDGDLDIYITKYVFDKEQLSENRLYINNGDLTFTEKAREFKLADRGFSVQSTFFDFDMDGLLDLYLINQPPSTGNRKGNKITLTRLKSLLYTDKIYKNLGDGTFMDATNWAIRNNLAFGLSSTIGDFNNDRLPDIYVANDYERPDQLYFNIGQGQYRNVTNQALKHMSNFSMGTDVADYDNDGLLDIVVVDMVAEDHKRIKTNMGAMKPEEFWENVNRGFHYQYMFNTLQRNNGNGTFSEVAHLAGVSNSDWSWGPLFGDFDNDGWKDLFITNGERRAMRNSDLDRKYSVLLDSLELVARQKGKELFEIVDLMDFVEMAPIGKLPNFAFKNNGDLTFSKVSKDWGLDEPNLSYGCAYADLDQDGDLEIIVNNTDDFAHIYRNNAVEQNRGHSLRFRILNKNKMPAYGARVKLYRDGKFWQLQELTNTRGYKSKSTDQLHFGLGKDQIVEKVEVTWPFGHQLVLENVKADQLLTLDVDQGAVPKATKKQDYRPFADRTNELKIQYRHKENAYDDYEREVLLPHKMSNFGPGLAVGDVNQDHLDDFYVGGAVGMPGVLYLQLPEGGFRAYESSGFEADKEHEDLGACFFDADSDGDMDLYVVSGGNEFAPGDAGLQDRLYLNDGQANFYQANDRLPKLLTSGSCVVPADMDGDGDTDLFVGGRLVPGNYPIPATSHILRNDNGFFKDVTKELAPELMELGLVTGAKWVDFSNDGQLDLVVVGEWMPVTFLENQAGKWLNVTERTGLQSSSVGWYYGIEAADFDGDGDVDLVAGNLGLNYKYKASKEEPFEIYSDDFDGNGQRDIVLGYHEHGALFPLRGLSCSSQQIPDLAKKFPTYESFGDADLFDVYGEQLNNALHYQARNFATVYLENHGDGTFTMRPLPMEAQFSSVNNIIAKDFNQDGTLDLLLSGNLYPVEIETPRNDAGVGLYLEGDGNGGFRPVPWQESGFFAPYDAKDMKMINVGGQDVVLVANNQQRMQAIGFTLRKKDDQRAISMN